MPYNRDIHYDTNELLDRCHELQIPAHIDSAWITASKDIEFDYNVRAIQSFAISLSKGLALGCRIGLRWLRHKIWKDHYE